MFNGSMVALVTPFRDGEVAFDTLDALVDWHIGEGTQGFVPVGTTGESPTLSHAEHEAVVERVVRRTDGRVPVLAGAGSNNTAEARRLVEHARTVGADGALVVTPYYNKPTQAGLIAHFSALTDVGLPIVIYNIPGRSVVDMSPATMGELSKLPNIVGVKDFDRRPGPGQRAAHRLRHRFHTAFGRRRDRRGLQRAGRDGLHLGHLQRGAASSGGSACGLCGQRLCRRPRGAGQTDAAASGHLRRARPGRRQASHVPARPVRRGRSPALGPRHRRDADPDRRRHAPCGAAELRPR